MYDPERVTGHELLRKLAKLAVARKVKVVYDSGHGKGSHGRVFFGAAFTALKNPKQEIGVGLLHKMCRDLGIKPTDL
jgi:mRNA interferase HicA